MHGITRIGITPLSELDKKKAANPAAFFSIVCYLFFHRKRAANFINLPGKHDCTRFQGFDHRTFCVFFLKFFNSIVERRKLKM